MRNFGSRAVVLGVIAVLLAISVVVTQRSRSTRELNDVSASLVTDVTFQEQDQERPDRPLVSAGTPDDALQDDSIEVAASPDARSSQRGTTVSNSSTTSTSIVESNAKTAPRKDKASSAAEQGNGTKSDSDARLEPTTTPTTAKSTSSLKESTTQQRSEAQNNSDNQSSTSATAASPNSTTPKASAPETTPRPAPKASTPETTARPAPTSSSTTQKPTPTTSQVETGGWKKPPANASFDYQIGGDYALPAGASIVLRDWFYGQPAPGAYSVCYVNAFQTQPDAGGNPDEFSQWPSNVVLTGAGQDPNWPGEYLIDVSTPAKRTTAAKWVEQMIDRCASKGFDAVEFDNLDSWTRFRSLPFGQAESMAYAKMITDYSHSKGLAVGQKNSVEIIASGDHRKVGFDFAIAEQCGEYNECGAYVNGYGGSVLMVEYDRAVFNRTCSEYGNRASVVLRDVLVRTPNRSGYVYEAC